MSVTNPHGQTAELPVKRAPEGYATTFAPLEPGPHKVNVAFANQELPKSPYPVKVEPRANVGAVTVKGLEKRKLKAWLDKCGLNLSYLLSTIDQKDQMFSTCL